VVIIILQTRRREHSTLLYFKSGYFNDASLIRPENIIDVHPNFSANLTRALTIDGGADVFWRYSRNDAVLRRTRLCCHSGVENGLSILSGRPSM